MEGFPILEIPEEIQALVVDHVASNSVLDLYNLRATCKSMKALTEHRRVYQLFDVLSLPWGGDMPISFLPICYSEGNPSTRYIKGVQYFFTWDLREEGLALMKSAADAGYERAVYTYAMTRKIFWDDEEYFARFTRESVERIGKLARSVKWGWGLPHSDDFRAKKLEFISLVIPLFSSCQCDAVVDKNWISLWSIDITKGNNMCNQCFWIKEVGLFFREFEPMAAIRDTRRW